MTRVRLDLFASLDGYTAEPSPENPMGDDWGPLTAAYAATRTFQERFLGDSSVAGTTGVDDSYAAAHSEGVGAEIMGAAMFGLHSTDDPEWKGWWGDTPPFGTPVFVLTHSVPRPSIRMRGERRSFHFRNATVEDVLAEATEAAGGRDVRVGGGISTARGFLRAGLVDAARHDRPDRALPRRSRLG